MNPSSFPLPLPDEASESRFSPPLRLLHRRRQTFIDLIVVASALGLAAVVVPSLFRRTVVMDAIDVPRSLEERGYSGEAVARRLRDELHQIYQTARPTILTSLKLADFSVEQRLPDVETPTGLTLRSLISSIRELMSLDDIHIAGEITSELRAPTPRTARRDEEEAESEPPPAYVIKLRSRGLGPLHQSAEPTDDLASVLRAAALGILESTNPALAGRYHEIARRQNDADRVARGMIASNLPESMAQGLLILGNVHMRRQKSDRAIADYERVVASDPKNVLALVNVAWALPAELRLMVSPAP